MPEATAMPGQYPFWSDDFDMDLLKVIPGAEHAARPAADVRLFTHGHATYGRLNHPTCWNHDGGIVAFFGLRDAATPTGYRTHAPVVECTWLELLRDAWPHTYLALVEGVPVFDAGALEQVFTRLMYHERRWTPMAEENAAVLRAWVRGRIEQATTALLSVVRVREASGA